MYFTDLKIKLRAILNELKLDNYLDYYEVFLERIREYAASGGEKDKVLNYLIELESDIVENELVEELILEASNRITGHCSVWKVIHFKR